MLETERSRGVAPIYAALGDPTRLAIVRRLSEGGPLPTARLRKEAGEVSRQGLTKHLRVLEDAGLLESSRVGRDRQWRLREEQLAALRDHLERISRLWDARLRALRAMVEPADPSSRA